ncbi:MAG: hypothetical protein JWR15_2633 [Prosthecobacter sp.]|nr:hypothetical protein [Prosthecobacter sp.]
MNRRTFAHTGALGLASTFAGLAQAADDGVIGNMSAVEFKKTNMAAGAKLKALKATTVTISQSDARLMAKVGAGGMMQLEASRLAVEKATSKDVRIIAEAEVTEQMELSAKLKEFATAKQVAAPSEPHKKTAGLIADLQAKNGADFDRVYLEESGVKGHELLQKTMMEVGSKATDPDLKALAATALTLIAVHLEVSKDEMKALS